MRSASTDVRLSEVLAGLSFALDLTEGQRPGHSVRTCAIGMQIADVLGLPAADRSALFYALLMKDLGCSSNASRFAVLFGADDQSVKAQLKTVDWPRALESFRFVAHAVAPGQFWLRRVWQMLGVFARGPEGAREVVRTRCERGADIARLLQFPADTVQAIRTIDEHWNGGGQPYALAGTAIPLLGRIVGLAQTVEVFASTYGVAAAYDMAHQRRGRWFDPALVDALDALRPRRHVWEWMAGGGDMRALSAYEPDDLVLIADDAQLDLVAEAFAQVIDAKSPWTYRHSNGVAAIAGELGVRCGLPDPARRELHRAALLHDLGKLGVSNRILDKPGRLDDEELTAMRRHPGYTHDILMRVGCFRHLAEVAASHHERLDGSGYHRALGAAALPLASRILCVADICDALRATRPYREGLPPEKVLAIMGNDAGRAIDGEVFAALRDVLSTAVADDDNAAPVRVVPALAEDYHQAA